MSSIPEARQAVAAAVTAAGIPCEPYPPDTTTPSPTGAAWIDTVVINAAAGGFCGLGDAEITVVAVGARNDRTGTLLMLEDQVPALVAALSAVPGLAVTGLQSGSTEVGQQMLPALIITLQARI